MHGRARVRYLHPLSTRSSSAESIKPNIHNTLNSHCYSISGLQISREINLGKEFLFRIIFSLTKLCFNLKHYFPYHSIHSMGGNKSLTLLIILAFFIYFITGTFIHVLCRPLTHSICPKLRQSNG